MRRTKEFWNLIVVDSEINEISDFLRICVLTGAARNKMSLVRPDIFQIVYTSSAKVKPDGVEIKKILDKARVKNEKNAVTGLLMVRGNTFIQLLEGDRLAVQETLNRITMDKRHSAIKIILEGPASRRIFESWSMGYIDEVTSTSSTAEVLDAVDRLAQAPGELRSTILKILKVCSHDPKAASAV